MELIDESKPRIAVARTLARKLFKNCKLDHPPIFLKDILNHLQEDQRVYIHSWNFGSNISGVLIVEEDCSTIGYNEQEHVHRNRFTVAHEIGHLLLGHTCQKSSDFMDARTSETEANQFAAELLMPLAIVKADLQKGIKDIPDLARRYWVSKEAVGWRIADPYSKLLRYI